MPPQITFVALPRTWLGRVLTAVAAIVVIVMAVFFLTIALAIAGVLVAVTLVRVMWLARRSRRRGPQTDDPSTIEVEYTRVDDRPASSDPQKKP